MRAIYAGHSEYTNEAHAIVAEYMITRSCSEIGYVFRGENLSAEKAIDFHLIAGEIAKIQTEAIEKERRKK